MRKQVYLQRNVIADNPNVLNYTVSAMLLEHIAMDVTA